MNFEDFKECVSSWLPTIKRESLYYWGDSLAAEFKSDSSPVTIADRAIENYIVSQIKAHYPSHSILGEESGKHQGSEDEYCWVIDPIDGTRSFMHGVPLFSSLIALTKGGEPLFGAIYLPITGDIIFGDGDTTTVNGKRAMMRDCAGVSEATILSSSISDIYKLRDGQKFTPVMQEARCTRTWGDGYGYFMLVAGRGDAMIDAKMAIWDLMPLIPIVRGAGGVITDYYGGDPTKGNSIIAASPTLHKELIDRL